MSPRRKPGAPIRRRVRVLSAKERKRLAARLAALAATGYTEKGWQGRLADELGCAQQMVSALLHYTANSERLERAIAAKAKLDVEDFFPERRERYASTG